MAAPGVLNFDAFSELIGLFSDEPLQDLLQGVEFLCTNILLHASPDTSKNEIIQGKAKADRY